MLPRATENVVAGHMWSAGRYCLPLPYIKPRTIVYNQKQCQDFITYKHWVWSANFSK